VPIVFLMLFIYNNLTSKTAEVGGNYCIDKLLEVKKSTRSDGCFWIKSGHPIYDSDKFFPDFRTILYVTSLQCSQFHYFFLKSKCSASGKIILAFMKKCVIFVSCLYEEKIEQTEKQQFR